MRILIFLIFSIFIFSGCENAKFNQGGEASDTSLSNSDGDVIEVIHNDEPKTNESNDIDNGIINGDNDKSDKGEVTNHDEHGGLCPDDKFPNLTPDQVFRDKKIYTEFRCGDQSRCQKVEICKIYNNQQYGLCVSQYTLNYIVKMKKYRVFLGSCDSNEAIIELPEKAKDNSYHSFGGDDDD